MSQKSGFSFGQYVPLNSPVHRMDPRAKILSLVFLLIGVFNAKLAWHWVMWWSLLVVIALVSRLGVRRVMRGAKGILFLCLFTVVLNLFLVPGEELWHWWIFTITDQSLAMAIRMGQRLMLLILFSNFLTLTTSPMALSDGLESLLKPLKLIKFPVHQMAMMMTIALRFIPTLMGECKRVMNAQVARGADLDHGGLIRRAKAFIPLLVPLFVIVFQRADELAQAMESRCYRGGEGRTRMKVFHWGLFDTFALALSAFLAFFSRLI